MCRNQVFSCENLSCTRREGSRGKAHSPRPERRRRHLPALDLRPGSAAIPHPRDALRLWAEGGAAAVEPGVRAGSTRTPVAEQLQLCPRPPRPAPHPRARLCLPDPQRSNTGSGGTQATVPRSKKALVSQDLSTPNPLRLPFCRKVQKLWGPWYLLAYSAGPVCL